MIKKKNKEEKNNLRVRDKPMTLDELEKGYSDENKENINFMVRSINKNLNGSFERGGNDISAIKNNLNHSPFLE